MLGLRALLVVADGANAFELFDRQIAVEGEVLAVEPRSHHCKNYRRRPRHWHHANALSVSHCHHCVSRVGYSWRARFRHQPHVLAALTGVEILPYGCQVGMFVKFHKIRVVYREFGVNGAQKTTGRARVLDHKMAQLSRYAQHLGWNDIGWPLLA